MFAGLFQQFGRQADRHDDDAIVIGHNDVAGHDQGVAAGDRHIDGIGEDVGLRVVVGGHAFEEETNAQLFRFRKVANTAVDHHAGATATGKVGKHHLAKDAAAHVATRINHHNVAGLGVVEDMAMELLFRVGIFIDAVLIFALGHKL